MQNNTFPTPPLRGKMETIKTATLNINGITSRARVDMLENFLRVHDIDIFFAQEGTSPEATNIGGYETHHNIGSSMRGTAILSEDGITLTNVTKLRSGRAIAAEYGGTLLINIYAPAVTAKRHEREYFLNNELPYLIRPPTAMMIISGDFNCVITTSDTTEHYNHSRALAELIHGFALKDTWQQNPTKTTYTHYLIPGATRIDSIYNTQELLEKKLGIEIIAAAFTDHHSVLLRLAVDTPILRMGRGRWKMNTAIFRDKRTQESMKTKWTQWKQHKKYYPGTTIWWVRYVKPQLRNFARHEIAERCKDRRQMENYPYDCLYDILHSSMPQEDKWPALQKFKEKIVKLHADRLQTMLLDTDEDRMDIEEPALYHVLKMQKRRTARTSQKVQDPLGHIHETPQGIIQTFARYFNVKYAPIEVDAGAIEEMAKMIRKISPNTYAELEGLPITPVEIHAALQKGGRNKAPGSDGIELEFYKTNWKIIKEDIVEILKQMFPQRSVSPQQKHGIIICLP
jgi:exonuclease III